MKIEHINIENFRCYKGLHNFKLGGKTIILYGENGYGKSSFFDAIEWCLTGNVERFRQPGEKYVNKNILLSRLANDGETCSVEMRIEGLLLKRSFNIIEKPREAVIVRDYISSDVLAQGKDSVEKFIEENIANKTANKKLISTLMKKSHILSQDQITDFVLRDNPKDRFDSLADIMGYRQLMNLGNNLKKVKYDLNQVIKKQNHTISTYKDIIESKKNEKFEIDIIEVNNIVKDLNININDSNILNELNNKEKLLIGNKGRLVEKLSNLNNLSEDIKSSSYIKLEKTAIFLKDEIEKILKRRNKIERLLQRINEETKSISKKSTSMDDQNKLLNEKKEIKKKVSELESLLSNILISEADIDNSIKKEEKYQLELFYAQTHLQNYKNFLKTLEETPSKLNEKKIKLEIIYKKLNKSYRYLQKFNGLLEDENEVISLNELNNAIQDVYSYVKNHKIDGICPVCSSDNHNNLSVTIYNNIQNNLSEISKKSNKMTKINEKIKRLKYRIEKNEKIKKTIENDIINLETNSIVSKDNIFDIKNSDLFSENIFLNEYIHIENMLKSSSEEINKLNNYKVNYYKLKSYYNKLNNLPEKELQSDQKRFEKLKNRSLNLHKRENSLNNLLESELEILENKNTNYELLKQNLFLLSKILPDDNKKHMQIDLISKEIIKEINSINSQLEIITKALDSYQKLKNNTEIEENIQNYTDVVKEKEKNVSTYNTELSRISEHSESIYNQIGSKASDLLNKPNSNIQKYFRYLNPLPGVNKVLFNSTSPEELEIILSYKNENGLSTNQSNVQYSLSSGQLYVLAISIFLAMNEDQSISKLEFVGIDDPIQNMDDVNQFSICDVLSSIKKQLIFSTHDFDFLKLYLKKNESKKDSIQVFMLENNDYSVTNVKEINF